MISCYAKPGASCAALFTRLDSFHGLTNDQSTGFLCPIDIKSRGPKLTISFQGIPSDNQFVTLFIDDSAISSLGYDLSMVTFNQPAFQEQIARLKELTGYNL